MPPDNSGVPERAGAETPGSRGRADPDGLVADPRGEPAKLVAGAGTFFGACRFGRRVAAPAPLKQPPASQMTGHGGAPGHRAVPLDQRCRKR